MYQRDLWVADPNNAKLYKVENDVVKESIETLPYATAVHVSQDMIHVYTAHKTANSVVRYREGERVLDIKVGEDPVAMCEDSKGNIYVANYTSSTISKISNGRVVKTINVSPGPRDLIADSRDKIYVCSYLGNVVDVIANDTVLESIPVKYGPRAIICDVFDNIWVACYTTNTLCKINNSANRDTIDLVADLSNQVRGPIALTSNKRGTIYIAGYLGNSVGVVESGQLTDIIGVSYGPTAISCNEADEIYVNSESGGTITKIVDKRIVSSFSVCSNPTCFGDFIGSSTYNIYNYTADGAGNALAPSGGWTMADFDTETRLLLNQVKAGVIGSTASLVKYDNSEYTSVQAALDKLLNNPPVINSFKLNKDTFEFGTEITELAFTWSFNKPMVKAIVKMGNNTICDIRGESAEPVDMNGSKTITGINITGPTNLVLEVTDEEGLIDIASVKVKFEHRFLYGSVDEDIAYITQVQLNELKKSPIMTTPYGKYFRIDCGEDYDKVPVIAVPTSWGIDETKLCLINGYSNDWSVNEVSYVNGVGGRSDYQVFRLGTPVVGELVVMIADIL